MARRKNAKQVEDIIRRALTCIEADRGTISGMINDISADAGTAWAEDKELSKSTIGLLEGLQRGNEQMIKAAAVVARLEEPGEDDDDAVDFGAYLQELSAQKSDLN